MATMWDERRMTLCKVFSCCSAFVLLASFGTIETTSVAVDNSTETDSGEVQETRNVFDILISIEEKLKPLEALIDRPSIASFFQSSMIDRLAKRVDAVETKLETRLEKLEETEKTSWGQSLTNVDRKMDKTLDKILSRMDLMEAKIALQLDSWTSKFDRLELKMENDVNGVLSRLTQLESLLLKLDTSTNDNKCSNNIDSRLTRIDENQQKLSEQMKRALSGDDDDDNQGQKCPWSNAMAADDTTSSTTRADWVNVTSTLTEALIVGEKKFLELDTDIEIYTRKVLNAYQELLKESKEVKDYLNKVIDHDNQTKIVVREGFRKMFQQLKPITTLEEILQALHKKVLEMGSTVDTSFASLLVAQNTFIASCHRIQQQEPMIETKIYHLLLKHIKDLEERWSTVNKPNTTELQTSFESHRKDLGRALHDLVWTVISVGNQTVDDVKQLLEQYRKSDTKQEAKKN